jgi:hypothetical protein
MTHIVLRDYSPDEYGRLTPAEKQKKLWQFRNPGKTPATTPTRKDHDATSIALTSTSSTGKHLADKSLTREEEGSDSKSNCLNKVLGCETEKCPCKETRKTD